MKGVALAIIFVLTGCSALVPSERHRSASVATTESIATESERTTQRQLSVTPEMAIAIGQNSNVVAVPLGASVTETLTTTSRTSTGAGSKDQATGNSSVTIPFFVKLIGAAIGIVALVWAIGMARKSSAAADAAFRAADGSFARLIGAVEDRLRVVTDKDELARLNAQLGALEKERGKLSRA